MVAAEFQLESYMSIYEVYVYETLFCFITLFVCGQGFAGARSPLVNIVERALRLRGPADIEVFDLSLPVKGDACRVNAWIPAHPFSGCPVLEELSLENCSWSNVNYRGNLLNEHFFYNSALPNEALIHLSYSGKKRRHIAYRFYKLLKGLSNVEDLIISNDAFEVVLNSAPELRSQMPFFNDSTTLVLEEPIDIGQKALLTMLQYCPCLETLVFLEGICQSSDRVEDDEVMEPLPPCFVSHLKTIEVGEFAGQQDEFGALKILVKNAMVLEKGGSSLLHELRRGTREEEGDHQTVN
ncbi:F-box/LRR-repeat protein At4g14096-like [Malus domestica]|uniref:F-box/LRR-repeat protein At4g14096-like n=1 Tax=Malus domestica TaxID=3750 RepID=UPI00397572D0